MLKFRALPSSDVDLDTGRLHVAPAGAELRRPDRIVFTNSRPTTPALVALDPQTEAVPRTNREAQAEWRLACRPGGQDHDLVFTHVDNRPFNPSSVTKTFFALVKCSGLPHVDIDVLRHSHGSHLLMAGVPALTVS